MIEQALARQHALRARLEIVAALVHMPSGDDAPQLVCHGSLDRKG
jgi:hypothetical protein